MEQQIEYIFLAVIGIGIGLIVLTAAVKVLRAKRVPDETDSYDKSEIYW